MDYGKLLVKPFTRYFNWLQPWQGQDFKFHLVSFIQPDVTVWGPVLYRALVVNGTAAKGEY